MKTKLTSHSLFNALFAPLFNLSLQNPLFQCLISCILIAISTVALDHSQLDLAINMQFFDGQNWLLDKQNHLFRFIFYDFPKRFLIGVECYLLILVLYRILYRYTDKTDTNEINTINTTSKTNKAIFKIFAPFASFSNKELAYLLLTSLLIPSVVGGFKAWTQVACPYQLDIFGGNMPYLNIIDSMAVHTGSKCFPASHASVGFALYTLAFMPSLHPYRYHFIMGVTAFAWTIGLYKMMIGDHFFSHTLVSMLVAWAVSSGIAWLFFVRKAKYKDIQALEQSQY